MNALLNWNRIDSQHIQLHSSRASRLARFFSMAAVFGSICAPGGHAVMLGQLDSFQDGTTRAWLEGPPSPNPPVNIATGGPLGAGDRYLQDISTGGSGAGSRLVMFNTSQWAGNYATAGVTQIVGEMANFGSTTLSMRITLTSGLTRFSSTSVMGSTLPPDGLWRTVTFDLAPSALTRISGSGTLNAVLSNVTELRVLSAAAGPAFLGDSIAATLGMDNLRAVPEPAAATALMLGALPLALRRRRSEKQSKRPR